ncbi:MAG TPA: c-type cytochrome domain-containing protein, partial [Chthoniobacteraceae bacterium]|nr:c-type cytochrome domain-containing protein [Chthoniobacteraceae bacterium]
MRSLVAAIISLPLLAPGTPVDFARDVLPILSDACFHCHGPDEKQREAKLRLDTKEGLYRSSDGITVVVPGKPGDSDLVVRVTSKDRDEVMPPPKANRQLTPPEIATLQRWVAEGAPFGRHWA